MTIPASDRRKEHAGNGVTTVFTGPRAFDADHIVVYLSEDATGTVTLVDDADYGLAGVNANSATTVTMGTAPASGYTLLILRTVPYTQETDITNQGAYLPEVMEDAYDALEQQIQQLADGLERAVHLGDTYVFNGSLELPAPQSLYSIRWNLAADALENYLPEADDASYVHIAGAETITGAKTFSGGLLFADAVRSGASADSLDTHLQLYTGVGCNITAGLLDAPDWNFYVPENGKFRFQVNGELVGSIYGGVWDTAGSRLKVGAATQSIVALASITAGTVALSCNAANYFTLGLSENITAWSITDPPAATYAQTIWIHITQHASAAKTVAWPASFQWEGGVAPSVSTGLSAVDVLCLTSTDSGTTWQATLAKGWAA